MIDLLVSLLESNIDYRSIIIFVLAYICSLWFLFSLWVYIDARKRFSNNISPILFFLAVFVLNFPGLIFYLIIRPEKDEDNVFYLHSNDSSGISSAGGAAIPVANFVGDDGEIYLSFQLKLNKKFESDGVNLNVAVPAMTDSTADSEKIVETVIKSEEKVETDSKKNSKSSFLSLIKQRTVKVFGELKSYGDKLEDIEVEQDFLEKESKDSTPASLLNSTDSNSDQKQNTPVKKENKKNKKKKKNKNRR